MIIKYRVIQLFLIFVGLLAGSVNLLTQETSETQIYRRNGNQ